MRALCLLALIGATLSGCCSAHRAWSDGYGACVPQGDGCGECGECSPAPIKVSLFRKRATRCSHCGAAYGSNCGGCGSACDGMMGGCSSCSTSGDGMVYSEQSTSGCSTCNQGQTAYEGSTFSMESSGTYCPTCHQNHATPQPAAPPTPSPPMSQPMTPPPAPPSAAPIPPMYNPPEPHEARRLEPLLMQPVQMSQQAPQQFLQAPQMPPQQMVPAQTQTQPVQYQEWQPHQTESQSLVPYNPPTTEVQQPLQSAVQPILWVPAQQGPLLLPAR